MSDPSFPPGFVSLVSAGPGDPDLLTLKAARRLAHADVVLFDDLASGPVLDHAGPQADLIAVGKQRWKKTLTVEISYALEGHCIHFDLLLLFTEDSVQLLRDKLDYLMN